jgi:membrane protein YqaA with SNARE-associated domain
MPEINKTALFQFLGVVVIIVIALWLSNSAAENDMITQIVASLGYVGLFSISIVSGFNVVVPIPVILFIETFLASGLHFWGIIVVISIGMTVGDTIGYLLGSTGRRVIGLGGKENKILQKLERFRSKNKGLPLVFMFFYAAFVPAPNELIVVPLALMGYRFSHLFVSVLIGNFIFNALATLTIMGFV